MYFKIMFLQKYIYIILCILILFPMKILSQKNLDIEKNVLKIGLLEYEPGDWNSDQTALTM